MIKVEGVTKTFGTVEAIKNVSFQINRGEIIGFLGQNGAGKTTLMRILTSYLPATVGRVYIDGQEITEMAKHIRSKIGYLPENPPLYMSMSVIDYLKFAAQLKNVPSKNLKKSVDRVLYDCNIEEVKHKTIGILSKGYKQRVGIAQAIINDPTILILDEPTSGLDPIQVQQVRKLIKNLETHRTVILSTHILSEIEQLAQRVLMIKEGSILYDGPMEQILAEHQNLEKAFLKQVGYLKHD